jgi:S-adenosylmethionine hydrolase
MKGVIAGICPEANVIDITHEIGPQDITLGAFVLEQAHRYFPAGTVHVAIVDPGVGTSRRPVAVKAGRHFFVGPDNGVLALAAERAGSPRSHLLADVRYFRATVSNTFHGRDIFAPVAAHIAKGIPIEVLGPELSELVMLPEVRPHRTQADSISGEVVMVDRFGNLVTNLTAEDIRGPAQLRVEAGGSVIGDVRRSYGDALPGEPLALFGSFGLLEIAVRDGSAADTLRLGRGAPIIVRFGVGPAAG